ncbi:hypothetical protein LY90DRAFT_674717 [Neocallimastix californiae]|uniref:Centrosomal protein 43 n=1 Tax=Neocallimastix californiae TaxID=1754190 RepID=A0A1Y2AUW2_9FUNG|nr:hypothetical protein LY90DRAFT_674717 [Neocallimastix californiae]|eukprot:ORY25997.1 hypothetical protein LY90DRAFT_674717 [Neocallimastix californiae]
MKSTKEIDRLKKLVSDTLVKDGTLGKIKAELRASVFSVINSNKESEVQLKNHDENLKKINTIKNLDGGIKMLELICDFLNFYGMTYTKSVLLAEASLPENKKIENNLTEENTEEPLLYTLFRSQFKSNIDTSLMDSLNALENDNYKLNGNIDLSNLSNPPPPINLDFEKPSPNDNILNDRKKNRIIEDDSDSDNKSDEANNEYLLIDSDLQTSDCSLTSENLSRYDYYEEVELKNE